jgi:acyl-CoA thioester hydrolase
MDVIDAPEFTVECGLRWSDFDRLGHLNQAVYHQLLEQSRVMLLDRMRPAELERWEAFVLAHVELDYRREVPAGTEQVIASARVIRVGTSSITLAQEVRFTDATVAASGSCVLVGWHARERGKRTFGEAERAAYGA